MNTADITNELNPSILALIYRDCATKEELRDLKLDFNHRFDDVDRRFEKIDARFEKIDARFEKIDGKFEKIDTKFEKVNDRLDKVAEKLDSNFRWLIGTIVALFGVLPYLKQIIHVLFQ